MLLQKKLIIFTATLLFFSLNHWGFSEESLPNGYTTEKHLNFMEQAVELSKAGTRHNGGPFGAIVVDTQGNILGYGHNRVALDNDPTAHGEVTAIRDAATKQGTFDLNGAILYTSTYPCPMCFSAAHWANISTIYYANTAKDVSVVFDDAELWQAITEQTGLLKRTHPVEALHPQALEAFNQWYNQMQQGRIKNYNPDSTND